MRFLRFVTLDSGVYWFESVVSTWLSRGQASTQITLHIVWFRASALSLSASRRIANVQSQGVTWLDMDHVDERYMLAGYSSGAISLFDVQVSLTTSLCVQVFPARHRNSAQSLELAHIIDQRIKFAIYMGIGRYC